MKARLVALLSLVLAVALLAGGLPAAAGSSAAELNVNAADAGREVVLDNSHVLVVNLEANPSTGYGWVVESVDGKVLRPISDEFKTPAGKLGAPGTQVLRYQAVAAGQTQLNLVYRRPWENVKPEKTFSINVRAKGALALPYKAPVVVDDSIYESDVQDASVNALPVSYNWCPTYCTAVRNQGSCGSCWAFGTVGVMEAKLKIANGVTYDAAEQYLVRCNSEGWGCGGGWFAHDYHDWKYITGEPGPGTVAESSMPYTGTDGACNPPHTHNWLINSWGYQCGSSCIPTTTNLKTVIYNYGPVSAAVYVGSAFQAYTSGIFTTTQTGTVNHAIVLTGWNDTYQYWNLRNSWGTGWGESGYMRIKYATSRVGYGTSYVW